MGVFDEMAARYDTPQRAAVGQVIADAMRPRLAGCTGKNAVDYGCGTGLVGLPLADCFACLLLVDASPQMAELVGEKIARLGIANAKALCADFAAGVPVGLGADVVIMAQVLLHIPDTENILRRLYGLLNPGGRLLIADFDKNEAIPSDRVHNGFVQAQLIALAKQIGFARAQAETFCAGENLFMNQAATMFLLEAAK